MDIYGIVYIATNILNGMSNIGQTKNRLIKRKHGHKNSKDNTPFHDAIRYYGFDNFRWEILKICYDKTELSTEEKKYIKKYSTFQPYGYNVNRKYNGHYEMSEETKRKISKKAKGRIFSDSHKKNLSKSHIGCVHPEEQKIKIRNSMKGKNTGPKSKETKQKISEANKGRKHSIEEREKRSKAMYKWWKNKKMGLQT